MGTARFDVIANGSTRWQGDGGIGYGIHGCRKWLPSKFACSSKLLPRGGANGIILCRLGKLLQIERLPQGLDRSRGEPQVAIFGSFLLAHLTPRVSTGT